MKIFHSIKKKFSQLNINENVWLSDTYYNHIKKKFRKRINHNFFFSILNILTFYLKKKNIITLDYGGGAGEYYYKHFFNTKKNNQIIVFDNKKITDFGKKKFKQKNIKFINEIKKINLKKINFLLFSSVAQYIENINNELKTLIHLKPDFIIFEDFHASANKSFVTYQKFFKKKIPVKFHQIKSLENFLKKKKYILIYRSSFLPLIRNEFKFYNMKNLPQKNRVNHTFNLVFKKI